VSERVWDRLLSEQDRAHVAMKARRPVGFGSRPALILIDLYRGVYGDKPKPLLQATETWPSSCGLAAWNALPALQELLATSRKAGIPIIHTRGLSDLATWGEVTRGRDSFADAAAEDRYRRRYDIIDEVAPLPGELVLHKSSPSPFWGTPLTFHLTALGIDTLIVGGESTSGCVRATVVDACSHRYKVTVVEDCVFDRHESTHALNLFDMHQKYADVLPLADALAYLRGLETPR
jgi:nicotinamidase-related amidase